MYHVRLSFAMIVAAFDIHADYIGDDSPRHLGQTIRALHNRGLTNKRGTKLTDKGKAYLAMLGYEYQTSKGAWLKKHAKAA